MAADSAGVRQRLADLAVADAPAFSVDQILMLRRVLKPYLPSLAATRTRTSRDRKAVA